MGEVFDNDENRFQLNYRAAYHDLRDPSTAYGNRAAISFLSVSAARDSVDEKAYLSELTLFNVESVEPRSRFFKPFSWRTSFGWTRPSANGNVRFTATGGGGVSYRLGSATGPVVFGFVEGDAIDDPSLPNRLSVQVGTRLGFHWEPRRGARFGFEWEHRELVGERRYDSKAAAWASLSPSRNGALVIEASETQVSDVDPIRAISGQWRWYF